MLNFLTNIDRQFAFYTRVPGMWLSDRAQNIVAFLHCPGGSDHHVLAFLAGDHPGFHHTSLKVVSVDEVGLGGCQMAKGHKNDWRLGQHVIASNFLHYIRDPWNGLAKYFCDIGYIPADTAWKPKDCRWKSRPMFGRRSCPRTFPSISKSPYSMPARRRLWPNSNVC